MKAVLKYRFVDLSKKFIGTLFCNESFVELVQTICEKPVSKKLHDSYISLLTASV